MADVLLCLLLLPATPTGPAPAWCRAEITSFRISCLPDNGDGVSLDAEGPGTKDGLWVSTLCTLYC